MKRSIALAALLCATGVAQAGEQQQLSLTVYNNNLALVQDKRTIDVTAGRNRLEFKDVSAQIEPETVALSSDGLSVVEQNFDYDLLTPSKMMEKAVGKQIQIVRINPATGAQTKETATVLSVNQGVVLRVGNHIEVLRDDGLPTRVIFDSIPENLRASPTLSVTVGATRAGPHETSLSYLTTGLSWKADYVALFDEAEGSLKFQGWVTLKNDSGTSFKNARTQLVAGDINTGSDTDSPANTSAGRNAANAGSIADYHLYTLPERVTLAQSQTKQVGFLDADGTKASKTYVVHGTNFESDESFVHAEVDIRFDSADRALPAGTVRVYMRDVDGEPKFVGEDTIGHTPAGSDIAVRIGEAFDVTAQATSISREKLSGNAMRYAMSYVVRNARDVPVTVELRQGGLSRDGKVESESLASRRIDASTLDWSVPVPAHGETILTYTVDSGS